MTINLDSSRASGVLITCTECPHWHAFQWTIGEAHASAARHESSVHHRENTAHAQRAREARHRARDTP